MFGSLFLFLAFFFLGVREMLGGSVMTSGVPRGSSFERGGGSTEARCIQI